jgi:hypothetical protein
MQCAKAHDQYLNATADWGPFCRYLEFGEDQFASRHVDVYSNGNCLRYDREHWVDKFGMLAEASNSQSCSDRRWSIEQTTRKEFEAIWNESKTAPNQPQNYDASSFADSVEKRGSELTPERLAQLPPWITALYKTE